MKVTVKMIGSVASLLIYGLFCLGFLQYLFLRYDQYSAAPTVARGKTVPNSKEKVKNIVSFLRFAAR